MSGRNDHELYSAYNERGVKAVRNRDEAMALARLLRGEAAYLDPKHPSHEVVKRDMKALYDNFVPNQPDVSLLNINGRLVMPGVNVAAQLGKAPVTPEDVLTARWNAGASAASLSAADRIQLRRMMVSQPAYRDPNHPEHAAYVESAKALYTLDAPKDE